MRHRIGLVWFAATLLVGVVCGVQGETLLLEGEGLEILRMTGGQVHEQATIYNWSGGGQLWWTGGTIGDRLALGFEVERRGTYAVEIQLTKAADYAIVNVFLDGAGVLSESDLYHPILTTTGFLFLGTHSLADGPHALTLEIAGSNSQALEGLMVGVDALRLVQRNYTVPASGESTTVGSVLLPLNGAAPDLRTRETNLANLVCDAMLWRAAASGASIALLNGGAIRASIGAGDVALSDVMAVLPHGSRMTLLDLSGLQIAEALEWGIGGVGTEAGGFLQVAGLRYQYSSEANAGERVSLVHLLDDPDRPPRPIEPDQTYTVVTSDFLADGGDGHSIFQAGTNRRDTQLLLFEALADYINEISPVAIAEEDRIVVRDKQEVARASLPTGSAHIDMRILRDVADTCAHEVWGDSVLQGESIPLCGVNGEVLAHAFTYQLNPPPGQHTCPSNDEIRNVALRAGAAETEDDAPPTELEIYRQRELALRGLLGEFGCVYVSATRSTPPILGASWAPHASLLTSDRAGLAAAEALGVDRPRLARIHLLGAEAEYYQFEAEGRAVLIHTQWLEPKWSDEVLDPAKTPLTGASEIADAEWEFFAEAAPRSIGVEEAGQTWTVRDIPHRDLIPIVDWTYWCVPTAQTMVMSYWDNYVPGIGTNSGFGRLVDCWYRSGSDTNIPSFIDVIIDPMTGTWRHIHIGGTDRTWGGSDAQKEEFLEFKFGYDFDVDTHHYTAGIWSLMAAYSELLEEVKSGRPFLWSYPGHATTGYGLRTSKKHGCMVRTYSTWGTTREAQQREWHLSMGSKFETYRPDSWSPDPHLVLHGPRGGSVQAGQLSFVLWFVWGDSASAQSKVLFTTIEVSYDNGATWDLLTTRWSNAGWNLIGWTPTTATVGGRLRVRGYGKGFKYMAGDGNDRCIRVDP